MSAFKAGFVALLGRPNAGKSTLLNRILGARLSIVSAKPQTTRHKIVGILDGKDYQVCFLDTPGLIPSPSDPLQRALRRAAKQAAQDDADIIVLLVEPEKPSAADLEELGGLSRSGVPVILALGKADIEARKPFHDAALKAYAEAVKPAAVLRVSGLKGDGVDQLLREVVARLPESPALYEPGQLSDRWERFFAAEIVREKVFELYHEEIPHATAVVVEHFSEQPGRPDEIAATLYVERDGQKGILLGKKGEALRRLSDRSRQAIEAFTGRPAVLDLWVKVRHNWRKDPKALAEFGYL